MEVTLDVVSIGAVHAVAVDLDESDLARLGVGAVAPRLVKELRGRVETYGHDLNPACVRVHVTGSDRPFCRKVVMRWLPPERAESELLGGSNDGRLLMVRESADGFPERLLQLHFAPRMADNSENDWPVATFNESYELVGFRNESARWVYRVRP